MRALESIIAEWFRSNSRSGPAPENIKAFNIGIFESTTGFTLYLIGSGEYDPLNDDWACREDYVPTNKYLQLPAEISRGQGWKEVEEAVKMAVINILKSSDEADKMLFSGAVVTTGFDDGHLHRVSS